MYPTVARLKTAQENVWRHVDELNSCKKKRRQQAWIRKVVCYVHGEGEQAAPKQKYNFVAGDNLFVAVFTGNSVHLMSSEGRRDWDAEREDTVDGELLNDNEGKCLKYK